MGISLVVDTGVDGALDAVAIAPVRDILFNLFVDSCDSVAIPMVAVTENDGIILYLVNARTEVIPRILRDASVDNVIAVRAIGTVLLKVLLVVFFWGRLVMQLFSMWLVPTVVLRSMQLN